jgi:hypothetical protein
MDAIVQKLSFFIITFPARYRRNLNLQIISVERADRDPVHWQCRESIQWQDSRGSKVLRGEASNPADAMKILVKAN